ncbi:MAG TPA: glycosyltransferase, partial [Chitinophagaceae bacterium]
MDKVVLLPDMNILYDHQMFSIQRYGGITKYFCEVISRFDDRNHFELALLCSENAHLREHADTFHKRNVIPRANFPKKETVRRWLYSLNNRYSLSRIRKGRYDIFHPTFYHPYFLNDLRKPFVLTVHDLIEFRFSEQMPGRAFRRKEMETTIRKAKRLIAISRHTKNDLVELFNIDPADIDVIHHGYNLP